MKYLRQVTYQQLCVLTCYELDKISVRGIELSKQNKSRFLAQKLLEPFKPSDV